MMNKSQKKLVCNHNWEEISTLIVKGLFQEAITKIHVIHNLEDLALTLEAQLGEGNYKIADDLLLSWRYRISNLGPESFWKYYEGLIKLKSNKLEESQNLLEEALEMIKHENLVDYTNKIRLALGQLYRLKNDFVTSKAQLERLLTDLQNSKDIYLLAQTNQQMGNLKFNQGNLDEALDYFKLSMKLFSQLDSLLNIAGLNNNIAMVYHYKGFINQALDYHSKALDIFQNKIKDKRFIALVMNNMANLFQLQGNLSKALTFHEQALTFRKEIGLETVIAMSYNNLGSVYYDLGLYDKAEQYQNLSLELRKKNIIPLEYAPTLVDLAFINVQQGKNISQEGILKEFRLLLLKNPNNVILGYKYILEALKQQQIKNYDKALKFWGKAVLTEGISFNYKIQIYEGIVECEFRKWLNDRKKGTFESLEKILREWETLCSKNNLTPSLCKIKLLRSRLFLVTFKLDNAQTELKNCIDIASENGLPLHKRLAQKELLLVEDKLKKILELAEKSEKFNEIDLLKDFEIYLKNIGGVFKDIDNLD